MVIRPRLIWHENLFSRGSAMNETLHSILNRRSIRKFRPEQFPRSDLDQIIMAGLYAPSSKNTQAWHFTVLRLRADIDELTAAVKAATARMPENIYKDLVGRDEYTVNFHAPTFVIVSVDPARSSMPQEDASLALGNMFLAAYSLGLDSCWINQLHTLNDEPLFRAYLTRQGVPENDRVYGCGTFGYAEKRPSKARPRREGTVTIVGE
jgi:nitroreductase